METPYLRSWKEIATYLKVSVRTVQRYKAMGLPVHRVGPIAAVFAIRAEVDAWLLAESTRQIVQPKNERQDETPRLAA